MVMVIRLRQPSISCRRLSAAGCTRPTLDGTCFGDLAGWLCALLIFAPLALPRRTVRTIVFRSMPSGSQVYDPLGLVGGSYAHSQIFVFELVSFAVVATPSPGLAAFCRCDVTRGRSRRPPRGGAERRRHSSSVWKPQGGDDAACGSWGCGGYTSGAHGVHVRDTP